MSTPSTSTRATDPYDRRRAASSVRRRHRLRGDRGGIRRGHAHGGSKIVFEICALIVACVAQLAFARGSIERADAQWSLVAVYALFVSVAHGVAKLVERDALVLRAGAWTRTVGN